MNININSNPGVFSSPEESFSSIISVKEVEPVLYWFLSISRFDGEKETSIFWSLFETADQLKVTFSVWPGSNFIVFERVISSSSVILSIVYLDWASPLFSILMYIW